MYCLKRIMIGIIFGLASSFGGTDKNIVFTLTFLILNELVFIFLRYRYEFRTNYFFNICYGHMDHNQHIHDQSFHGLRGFHH